MTGGLMQLVAYGAQDIYLTGNPLITYFKNVYRRHTNFAVESIAQTFTSTPGFGQRVESVITHNGDLMMGAYIQAVLPDLSEKRHGSAPQYRYTRWIDNVGHYLIDEVSVSIGGTVIDTHYGDWLEIWSQLTVPASRMRGYLKMIGQDPKDNLGQNTGLQKDVFSSVQNPLTASVHTAPYTHTQTQLKGREVYIPLQFWFCRNEGLALPLIALQHHEVKIAVQFRPVHELVLINAGDQTEMGLPNTGNWLQTSTGYAQNIQQSADLDVALWIDYVFLDTDERRRFAQVSHEYLIEQVQRSDGQTVTSTTSASQTADHTIDLFFSHPVKELVWVVKAFEGTKEWCNFTDTQLPTIPPFTDIGRSDTENIIGLSGLPTGYISLGTLSLTLTVTSATSAIELANEDETGVGYTWTASGDQSILRDGDICLLYDETYDRTVHVTYRSDDTTYLAPEVALTGTYALESVFRPTAGLTLGAGNTTATGATNSSLGAVTTWDHLNRLTNYDTVRPVNSYGWAQNPVRKAQLRLNGHERFSWRPGSYFNWVQCRDRHTNIPRSPGINVYSFAICPEQHQPSGTCNFSRLDSAQLILSIGHFYNGTTGTGNTEDGTLKDTAITATARVYAVNYNILRIMSGMGGVAYTG